jgi:hypothetical protein
LAAGRIRYISDAQYGARLIGSGSNPLIWTVQGAYTDIVGFDFDGSINTNTVTAIGMYNGAFHTWVLKNKIHDLSFPGGIRNQASAIGSCIYTGTYPSGSNCTNTIESNLIYHNNGGANAGSSFGDSEDGISTGWHDTIQNNIVLDQGGGWCISATHTSDHVTVTNNTIANCARGGIMIANQAVTADYSTFSNNIVVNAGFSGGNSAIRIYSNGGCGPHNVYANNLLYGGSPSNYQFDNGCPNTATGTLTGSNATTFVNYTGTITGDYHLKVGSPGIGSGAVACAAAAGNCVPRIDFDGAVRDLSSLDIGSFAFSAAGSVPAAPLGLTAVVQ